MFKHSVVGFVLICTLIFPSLSMADSNATKSKDAKTEKKDSSSLEAAKKLLKEMNLEKVYKDAVEASTKRLVMANSKFKKVEKDIRAFYEKYIGWNAMKDDLAKLYAKYYTAKELEDIANFYKTPTGQKVLKNMPKLSIEGQIITQGKLQSHLEELKKILDSALEENKSDKNETAKEAKKEDKKETKKEDKKEQKKDSKK